MFSVVGQGGIEWQWTGVVLVAFVLGRLRDEAKEAISALFRFEFCRPRPSFGLAFSPHFLYFQRIVLLRLPTDHGYVYNNEMGDFAAFPLLGI